MKNYNEYLEDYKKAIEPGLQKNDGYIIKESVYISMRWQKENNWNPWDKDAKHRLEALKLFDIRLYQAVVEGNADIDELAVAVIRGEYGNYTERRERLGGLYEYEEVKRRVYEMLNAM